MTKHISGPIEVGYEFDETGYPVFVVKGLAGEQKRDRQTLEATAQLFAAAPDLLEALILLEKEMVLSGNASSVDFGWKPAIEKTRAAIAKATKLVTR